MCKVKYVTKKACVEFLGIPRTSFAKEKQNKVSTIEDLCSIGIDKYLNKSGKNPNSINRFIYSLADGTYDTIIVDVDVIPSNIENCANSTPLYEKMKEAFGFGGEAMLAASMRFRDADEITFDMLQEEHYFLQLIQTDILRCAVRAHLSCADITLEDYEDLRTGVVSEKAASFALRCLIKEEKITETINGHLRPILPTVDDFVTAAPDNKRNKNWFVMQMVLQGASRKDIAEYANVTRQNVSRVVTRDLSRRCVLEEDKYIYLFSKYRIPIDVFCKAFNEPEKTFFYLNAAYQKGKEDYINIINDNNNSVTVKRIKDFLKKNNTKKTVPLEGDVLKRNPNSLRNYAIQRIATEPMTIAEVEEAIQNFAVQNGLENDKRFVVKNNIESLFYSKITVWSHPKTVRYYDMTSRDFSELYRYIVSFMSGKKFTDNKSESIYNGNPELMRKYDIRNYFELHNIIRKTQKSYLHIDGVKNISLARMASMYWIVK